MKTLSNYIILGISICTMLISCAKDTDTQPLETIDFKGTWAVNEQSKDFGASTYNVSISDSLGGAYIHFAFLYGFNKKVKASVSGKQFSIPNQLIQANNVSGNGTLTNSSRIDMKYYVQSTTTHFDTITAILRK